MAKSRGGGGRKGRERITGITARASSADAQTARARLSTLITTAARTGTARSAENAVSAQMELSRILGVGMTRTRARELVYRRIGREFQAQR